VANDCYLSVKENELIYETNPISKSVIFYIKPQNQSHKLAEGSKIIIRSLATQKYLTMQDKVLVTDGITKGSIFTVNRTVNGIQLLVGHKFLIFSNQNSTLSNEDFTEFYSYIIPIKHGSGIYTLQSAFEHTKKLSISTNGTITTVDEITPYTQLFISRIE